MPTIEIVSLDCNRLLPIKNSTLPFTVLQNRKLISHRSLFQEELNKINGTILHLGNKEFGRNTYFFASELIDWDSEIEKMKLIKINDKEKFKEDLEIFTFTPSMFASIIKVLKCALKYSPINKIFFYTDIQTGNDLEVGKMYGNICFEDFIKKQNREYYIFNTLYEIHK